MFLDATESEWNALKTNTMCKLFLIKHSFGRESIVVCDRWELAFSIFSSQGDIILSVDGVNMEEADHPTLVHYIKGAGNTMRWGNQLMGQSPDLHWGIFTYHFSLSWRMVVMFEDCCRKVELHMRTLRLHQVLNEKLFELRALETQERRLLSGKYLVFLSLPMISPEWCSVHQFSLSETRPGHSPTDPRRLSYASSLSSYSSETEDRLSLRPELDICPSSSKLARSVSKLNNYLNVPVPTFCLDEPDSDDQLKSSEFTDNFYSLPTKGRLKAQAKALNRSLDRLDVSDSDSIKEVHSAPGSPKNRHQLVTSVSGDVSYVRENSPQMKSSKSLGNFRSESTSSLIKKPPQQCLGSRRFSFRRKIHLQQIRAGHHNLDCGDFVVTEHSGRSPAEPELISLRKLVNDFRMDYIQHSLVTRHKNDSMGSCGRPVLTSSSALSGKERCASSGFIELSAEGLMQHSRVCSSDDDSSFERSSPIMLRLDCVKEVGREVELRETSSRAVASNHSFSSWGYNSSADSDSAISPSEDLSRCSWGSDVFDASTPKLRSSVMDQKVLFMPKIKPTQMFSCRKLEYINEVDEITKLWLLLLHHAHISLSICIIPWLPIHHHQHSCWFLCICRMLWLHPTHCQIRNF